MSREIFGGTSSFVQVGEPVLVHDGTMDYTVADDLRRYVLVDFMGVKNSRTPELDESHDKTIFSKSHEIYTQEGQDARRFVGTVLTHWRDAWRLAMLVSKTSRSGWNNGEQRLATRYSLECHGQTVVQARKQVKVIRPVGELLVEHIAAGLSPHIQRRVYERQMTLDDIDRLVELFTAVKRRSIVD